MMRRKVAFIISTIVTISLTASGQSAFLGHSGVYYLGSVNAPLNNTVYSNPDISGVVLRFTWEEVEKSQGNYDWSFVDAEIAKAINNNKKVSLQPLGKPSWLTDLDVQTYFYVERNPNHPSFGKILTGIIPWDNIYVKHYKLFLDELAKRYDSDTTVTYVNAVAVALSRNLPDTIITDTLLLSKEAFWKEFPYHADTFAQIINDMTDYYMFLFPNTPLWCSVDYVRFEHYASSRPVNYLASLYTNYGISKYPDRFGLFREDISGCNPMLPANQNTHWYIMEQQPCRTGAQMLWSVQDGPSRMNQCNISPNNKVAVLDSAVNKALYMDMRYLEIYGADISDTILSDLIRKANTMLLAKGDFCIQSASSLKIQDDVYFSVFPNPAKDWINLVFDDQKSEEGRLSIYNANGKLLYDSEVTNNASIQMSCFPEGIYMLRLRTENKVMINKLIIRR